MPDRRVLRPIKKPVFLAGEGLSERGYGRWLNRLASRLNLPVAIKSEGLQGGDPLDLVQQAIILLTRAERQRGKYLVRGLLLDSDRRGQSSPRDREAVKLARKVRMRLIWQQPVHEAFLMRHFSGYRDHRPVDKATAERHLSKIWPSYSKGMDANGYGSILTADHLKVVRSVETEFNSFLVDAGWPR